LADELIGAARGYFAVPIAVGVVGRRIVFLVVFDLFDDQLFLEDDIEGGFDIVVIIILVLFLLGISGFLGASYGSRSSFLLGVIVAVVITDFIIVDTFVAVVIAEEGLVVFGKFLVAFRLRFFLGFEFFFFDIVSHKQTFRGGTGGSIDRQGPQGKPPRPSFISLRPYVTLASSLQSGPMAAGAHCTRGCDSLARRDEDGGTGGRW
jgi:hypothetical protein